MPKFTNTHIHVFNADCAPENFLRIIPFGVVRLIPGPIKWLIERRSVRKAIRLLNRLLKKSKRRNALHKYVSFLQIGTQRTQKDVFEIAFKVAKQYDSEARVVGLTMDMDHMDNQGGLPKKPLETQLAEVRALKSFYPENFFPFLGVDPRTRSGKSLVNWARGHFEQGVFDRRSGKAYPYFTGIKLYPALGFFPFDPRLEELFRYAEENQIPVMSHCTRSGSMYVGSAIESLIPRNPPMMTSSVEDFPTIQKKIHDRIDRYYEAGLIKNKKRGANDLSCDLFCHPENYIPVMMKFPKLKICLAHMGGTNEILWMDQKPETNWQKADGENWSALIPKIMKVHTGMYTDISYTLADLKNSDVLEYVLGMIKGSSTLINDLEIPPLGDRILFGTDFYMTEQEATEAELYQLAVNAIPQPYFDQITRDNPSKYLFK